MVDARLARHGREWQRKRVLREVYHDLYRRMAACCVDGATLEVGAGSGNFKSFAPEVVCTDLLACQWLDVVADAHALPFASESFANIVMFDTLHHIQRPRKFLGEAERILSPGGRLVAVEPGITPVSWLAYKLFHPEPILLDEDPLSNLARDVNRDAFDANQAIPTLLFYRHRQRFAELFPRLRVLRLERLSLLAFPLSGGFRSWSLIPAWAVAPVLGLERMLLPLCAPLAAFRLLIVLSKSPDPSQPESAPSR